MNSTNRSLPSAGALLDQNLKLVEQIVLASIFIAAVIGNTWVLIVMLRKRHRRMTRVAFFILHLTIADLLVAFFSVLPMLVWKSTTTFLGGDLLCRIVTFLMLTVSYISVYTLVAMANDRYQAIVHPLTSYTWTPRAGLVHMISVWCLSLVLASPQLVIFRLAEHPSHGTKTCMAKFPGSNRTWELVYIAWNIVVQFLLPVCILIFCYCSVYIIVNQNLSMYRTTDNCKTIDLANLPSAHSRKRSNMSAPSTSTADRSSKKLLDLTVHYPSTECTHLAAGAATFSSRSSSLSSSHILRHVSHPAVLPLKRSPGDFVRSSSAVSVNDVKPRQDYAANHFLYRARLKTIKFTFIVVLTYILCSAPFYIGSIIMTLHEKFMMQKSMNWLMTIFSLLFNLNSCSNPIICLTLSGTLLRSKKDHQHRAASSCRSQAGESIKRPSNRLVQL